MVEIIWEALIYLASRRKRHQATLGVNQILSILIFVLYYKYIYRPSLFIVENGM